MSLAGWKFGLAVGINFVLGALMSAGIGLYAPCMVTLGAPRNASARGLPHHDGRLRTAAARGESAIFSNRHIRVGSVPRAGLRRSRRRARRRIHRQVVAADLASLAGHRRHHLYGFRHAALGGTPRSSSFDGDRSCARPPSSDVPQIEALIARSARGLSTAGLPARAGRRRSARRVRRRYPAADRSDLFRGRG